MGFRFRKSIRIAKGIRVSIGKNSVGISGGVKGARVSVNSKTGARATVSAPGTGLSYSQKIGGSPAKTQAAAKAPARWEDEPVVAPVAPKAPPRQFSNGVMAAIIAVCFGLIALYACLT